MENEKVIRTWRMQVAKPFGVHLWFDPSVESVLLIDEPVEFLEIEETEKIYVDKPAQQGILGEYASVSGQAGGAEGGDQDSLLLDREAEGDPVVPF